MKTNKNNIMKTKQFLTDYTKFWNKHTHDKKGKRVCKYPFTHWLLTCLIVATISILFSSCGMNKLTTEQLDKRNKIDFEMNKLWIEYQYKTDSLHIEYYKIK